MKVSNMEQKQGRNKTKTIIVVSLIVAIIVVGAIFFSSQIPQEKKETQESIEEEPIQEYALEVSILSMNKTTIEEYRLNYHDFVNVSYYIFEVKIENIGQESLYVSYRDFYLLTNNNEKIDPTYYSNLSSELIKGTWISGTIKFDLDVDYDYSKLDKLVFDQEFPYLYHIHEEWVVEGWVSISMVNLILK